MAEEGKKVSFGFAKSIKKSALKILPPQEERKVDYIECLDEKSIKVVGEEEKVDGPLVIPLLGSKTWHDRILNKTDADIFESKTSDRKENGILVKLENGNSAIKNEGDVPMDVCQIKKEKFDVTEDGSPRTLEEQAAREIIKDLHGETIKVENPDLEVPVAESETLRGERESTLEDYEQIPIDVFGLAMLRGMGWKPGKGIGKNEKLVAAALPELRPRGMGLGADKVTLQKQSTQSKTKEDEQLKIEKGTFVRVIAGKHVNNYGEIEGFDDEAGRLVVKMALTGERESLNESLVQPVTKTEYSKNSKVLNATKYEEYKKKRAKNDRDETSALTRYSESSDEEGAKSRREDREESSRVTRKAKKRSSRLTSDESTESDQRTSKRGNSTDSENDHRRRRTKKKSKKTHKRDGSVERSGKKNKKRDKEREKGRERKSDYSESSDRRKHKRHKRSRSPPRR